MSTTRRYPRTLAEAFGPYTDNRLQPMDEPPPWRRSDLALAAIAVGVLALLFSGVI